MKLPENLPVAWLGQPTGANQVRKGFSFSQIQGLKTRQLLTTIRLAARNPFRFRCLIFLLSQVRVLAGPPISLRQIAGLLTDCQASIHSLLSFCSRKAAF